jgi:predicted transcriptional regulator
MTEKSSVDTMTEKLSVEQILSLTTDIVAAHVSNNTVATSDLPNLIQQVFGTLNNVQEQPTVHSERPKPAVPIKRSVTPEYIVCLEDGKKLKMLKRHLMATYGMSVEQYKARWGLPTNYPTVAPAYSEKRSSIAKAVKLGQFGKQKKKTEGKPQEPLQGKLPLEAHSAKKERRTLTAAFDLFKAS